MLHRRETGNSLKVSRDKDKGMVVKVMHEFIPREIHQTHTGSWSVVN